MADAADLVCDFWLNEIGPKGWYVQKDEIDDAVRTRFSSLVDRALAGELDNWAGTANGCLALLILLDQFPRNLHRGSAKAFAGDAKARAVARRAVAENKDLDIPEPGRQFFYLPFEHAEDRAEQDWCIALFKARMNLSDEMMMHVEKHREIIYRFGRFPYRNEALGREPTPEETAYLEEGGYTPGKKG